MAEDRDEFRDYQDKRILLDKVEKKMNKMLESGNPKNETISKTFGDKIVSITIEIKDLK